MLVIAMSRFRRRFRRDLVPGSRLSAPELAPRRILFFLKNCYYLMLVMEISRFRQDLAPGLRLSAPEQAPRRLLVPKLLRPYAGIQISRVRGDLVPGSRLSAPE